MSTEVANKPKALSAEQCLALLCELTVGRIGWVEGDGDVTIIPVNFAVDSAAIVFRTSEKIAARVLSAGAAAAFQADELEPAMHAGWSVLVHGHVEQVAEVADVARIHDMVQPWSGADLPVAMRLLPRRISGRQIPVHPGGVFLIHEN